MSSGKNNLKEVYLLDLILVKEGWVYLRLVHLILLQNTFYNYDKSMSKYLWI